MFLVAVDVSYDHDDKYSDYVGISKLISMF